MKNKPLIKSRKRVVDHGEVFTSEREVNSMLDLVINETKRIDSRFLEPACGDGNFLVQILKRKLDVVNTLYRNNVSEFNKNSVMAITSIYGVELLDDNVTICRIRLSDVFKENYKRIHKVVDERIMEVVKHILEQNIICGDALTLKESNGSGKPLVFSEWSFIGSNIKQRQYTLSELLETAPSDNENLFSDMWDEVFIPRPIREFPLVNYLKVGLIDEEKWL